MRRASSGIPSLFTNGNTAAFSGAIAGCSRRTTRFSPATSSSWYASTITTRVDRKSTRLNSSHDQISYAVFCLKKKKKDQILDITRTDHAAADTRAPPTLQH